MIFECNSANSNHGRADFFRAIKPVVENTSQQFFSYLDEHLRSSGTAGVPLFQPAPKGQSGYLKENEAAFIEGLGIPVGSPKWRRAWVAVDAGENIVGHVDLRARMEPCSSHRALLGMGVRIDLRGNGIGRSLLDFVTAWALQSAIVEIIDLDVLSKNFPAISLYEKAGFTRIGEVEDMFRIDGQSVAHIMMTKRL